MRLKKKMGILMVSIILSSIVLISNNDAISAAMDKSVASTTSTIESSNEADSSSVNEFSRTDAATEDTAVAKRDTDFTEDSINNSQSESMKPKLTVIPAKAATMAKAGDPSTVEGVVNLSRTQMNQAVTLHAVVNQQPLTSITLSAKQSTQPFKIIVPANNLKNGINSVTVYATAPDVERSTSAKVQINVAVPDEGSVSFTQSLSNYAFNKVDLNGHSQLIQRQSGWHVEVSDSHTKLSKWRLSVQATQLTTSTGQILDGGLVYCNGHQEQSLVAKPVVVASGVARNYNVTDHWQADTGILLRIGADAVPGDYTGKLTWTVTSAP